MSRIACPNCSREYDEARSICPGCGHDRKASFQSFAPSIVIAGPDRQTGGRVVKVADPSVQSEARRGADGSVSLNVVGSAGIGRPGESRVALTLKERLVRDGHQVEIVAGDDSRGVDRRCGIDGETLSLQVTIAPQASSFWRDASRSSATTQVSPPHAAAWLREAILTKADAARVQDSPVVLAVDARHAGVVAMPDLVQEYLGSFGSPVREFGFASVWIVGPTADYCARLGDG